MVKKSGKGGKRPSATSRPKALDHHASEYVSSKHATGRANGAAAQPHAAAGRGAADPGNKPSSSNRNIEGLGLSPSRPARIYADGERPKMRPQRAHRGPGVARTPRPRTTVLT